MRRIAHFIHELPGWPGLTWDAGALANPLALLRHRQGRLLGRMEALGFDIRDEANVLVLTRDVVESAAIEGEHLEASKVRSSIARKLEIAVAGLSATPSQRVDGLVEVMLDATQRSAGCVVSDRL